jgi:hypothetical protein
MSTRNFLIAGTFFLALFSTAAAQTDEAIMATARRDVDTLCSPGFAGRGYLDDGHTKAATYIARRFQELGLRPAGGGAIDNATSYFQPFTIRTNVIREAEISLNGSLLEPGADFIVASISPAGTEKGCVYDAGYGLEKEGKMKGKIVMLREGFPESLSKEAVKEPPYKDLARPDQRMRLLMESKPEAFIILKKKLTASFSADLFSVPVIEIQEDSLPAKFKKAALDIEGGLTDIRSQNVAGLIPGSLYPDTVILICGHYDHLGRLDDAIFTGANDNASGISLLLSLAEYFAKPENRQSYSLVFIAFGGEETGLVGSRYYATESPLFPLANTRFVLNLDLMGNGVDGITAVCGIDFPDLYDKLVSLNDELQAVPLVKARANAPNSDHYFFAQQGIPSLFIYTMGGPPHYHDINDTPANLEFSRFTELRTLFIRFLSEAF